MEAHWSWTILYCSSSYGMFQRTELEILVHLLHVCVFFVFFPQIHQDYKDKAPCKKKNVHGLVGRSVGLILNAQL